MTPNPSTTKADRIKAKISKAITLRQQLARAGDDLDKAIASADKTIQDFNNRGKPLIEILT